jgi:acyl-coenzyme A thioesterase PaaI-like protein
MSQKNNIASQLKSPFKFKLFTIKFLPMAFLAGLKIIALDDTKAIIGIRYKYLNKNPFRSLYFACLAMAAEMSTGVFGFIHTNNGKPSVAMLITGMEAEFIKKATGRIQFTCEAGNQIKATVEQAKASSEPVVIPVKSSGVDENGDVVAVFTFTWSFKARKN